MDVIGVPDAFKPTDYAPYSYVSSGNKMHMRQNMSTSPTAPFGTLLASIVLPTENSAISDVYLQLSGSCVVTVGTTFGAATITAPGPPIVGTFQITTDTREVEDPILSMINNIAVNIGGQSFNVQNVNITSRALDSYFNISSSDTFKKTQRNLAIVGNTASSSSYNTAPSTSFITDIDYTLPAATGPCLSATVSFNGICKLPISIFKVPIYNINAITVQINMNTMSATAGSMPFVTFNTALATLPVVPYTVVGNFTDMSANLLYTVSSSFSPIPKELKYINIDYQITTSTTLAAFAAGTPATFTSGTLTSSSVPNGYLIFVAGLENNERFYTPINQITVSFMNKSSLLANAQPVQLWRTAKSNGYHDSYRVFQGGPAKEQRNVSYGATMAQTVIDTGTFSYTDAGALYLKTTDLNIDDGVYPGMAKQAQFSCVVQSTNYSYNQVSNATLYVLPIYEEVVTMAHNSATRNRVFVSSTPTGGSFLNDFLGTAKDVWNMNIPGLVMRVVDSFGSEKAASSSLFD